MFFMASIVMLSALAGCVEVLHVDTFDPRLPEYSESGRNHAGAYINDEPWRSYPRFSIFGSSDRPFFRYDSATAHYVMTFSQGNLITSTGAEGAEINMAFFLSRNTLAPIFDGIAEFPVIISLGGADNQAALSHNGLLFYVDSSESCFSHEGLLYIRHFEIVPGNYTERLHLAGTFGFDIDDECGRYAVRSGRFDFLFECPEANCP